MSDVFRSEFKEAEKTCVLGPLGIRLVRNI